jgi:hypothetical protein
MAKKIVKKEEPKEEIVTPQTTGEYIVWLKCKAYVSDTERLVAGVYAMTDVPARLLKLPEKYCEVFKDEVPSKKVAQIGKFMGLNTDNFSDEEILSKVVTIPKPFV